MYSSNNHIIEKVYLEVNTRDEKTANTIKNNISTFLSSEVFPLLEKLFNKYNLIDQTLRFDTLDVNFDIEDWERLEEIKFEFLKSVEHRLEKTITLNRKDVEHDKLDYLNEDGTKKSIVQRVNNHQNYQSTVLFFLKYGCLPWFGKQDYIEKISFVKPNKGSKENKQLFLEIIELFRHSNTAIKRFVFQFTDAQVLDFIDSVGTIKMINRAALENYIQDLTSENRYTFLRLLLDISIKTSNNKELIVEFAKQQATKIGLSEIGVKTITDWHTKFMTTLRPFFNEKTLLNFFQLTKEDIIEIINNIDFAVTHQGAGTVGFAKTNLEYKPTIFLQDFVKSEREKEPLYFNNERTEIVVQNAGLVLFHPFLKAFFSQFGWINQNGEIKEQYKYQAVQALHYCATGKQDFFEGNLLLEKFLCNVSLATTIPYASLLNEEIRFEADSMAKELVKHWTALKSTSPAGLREMFVNRNGKLIQKENSFKLIVERKVQDILLDKLQWNISVVKLPWKDDLLFVEW